MCENEARIKKINEIIDSKKCTFQLKILSGEIANKMSIISDLEKLNAILFLYGMEDSNSLGNINILINEIKSEISKDTQVILIQKINEDNKNKKEVSNEIIEKFRHNFKFEYFEILEKDKKFIINEINNILRNIADSIIQKKINEDDNKIKEIKSQDYSLKFNDKFTSQDSKAETKKKEDNNNEFGYCDEELYKKISNDVLINRKMYSFFLFNRFDDKIFNLFNKIQNYISNNFESIYDFMEFLNSEKNNLEEIIHQFPLIDYKNRNAYLAAYYFYSLNKLLNIYDKCNIKKDLELEEAKYTPSKMEIELENNKEEYNKEDENKEESYVNENNNDNKDEKKQNNIKEDEKNNNEEEDAKNYKENDKQLKELEKKDTKIEGEEDNEYEEEKKKNKILLEERKREIINEIQKANIHESKNNNENNINELNNKLIKLTNILDNFGEYFTKFFQRYLCIFSDFLKLIPDTLNYFKQKILIKESANKKDLEEFDLFIFYIFNIDYLSNFNFLEDIAMSFEGYFKKNKIMNDINCQINGFTYKIENNQLLQIDKYKEKLKLENANDYCFELIKKGSIKHSKYINQKYLWFFTFKDNNIFEKNKNIYKEFFKKIFKSDSIKNLFINIFPYLQDNFIINDNFIDEFFSKIKSFNFKPDCITAETISPVLNVYIKCYFEGSDNIECEVCAASCFIILIFHELAHFLRIYIYKKTGDKKYRESINLCSNDEIGEYLEQLLFGEIVNFINFYQAIFLLNIKNYNLESKIFISLFKNLGKDKNEMKNFKKQFWETHKILTELGIKVNEHELSKSNISFPIKGGENYISLGINSDKTGRSADLSKIFKNTGFECLLKKNN